MLCDLVHLELRLGMQYVDIELADHHREFGQRCPGFDILEVLLQ
jgi:hypothetical protein